jgi:glycosyltransferase involved in cell wall biosynthesis
VKPRIVVSGVNLVEGGPLAVFQDALQELSVYWKDRYDIVALVHRRELFEPANVAYLEFPQIKRSWLRRLHFEYWQCRALSKSLKPHLWLALHDITPRVEATIRAVYCHNPAPFYRQPLGEALRHWRFTLFTVFYGILYRINLRHNRLAIVQQQWLREEFARRYAPRAIVVAHPSIASPTIPAAVSSATGRYRFFYPALPRSFKNIETILAAARLLANRRVKGFEISLTVDGTESRYAAALRNGAGDLHAVHWLGPLPRQRVLQLYTETDCLIFPSKLETWGLPISEFRQTGRPMLLADLPYARETAGGYRRAHFFAVDRPEELADAMERAILGSLAFHPAPTETIPAPFAADWRQLFELLLDSPGF